MSIKPQVKSQKAPPKNAKLPSKQPFTQLTVALASITSGHFKSIAFTVTIANA